MVQCSAHRACHQGIPGFSRRSAEVHGVLDVVLRISERSFYVRRDWKMWRGDRLDHAFYSASKLVMTVYQQSRGHGRGGAAEAFQTRCLNVVDQMILADRGPIESELKKLDESQPKRGQL